MEGVKQMSTTRKPIEAHGILYLGDSEELAGQPHEIRLHIDDGEPHVRTVKFFTKADLRATLATTVTLEGLPQVAADEALKLADQFRGELPSKYERPNCTIYNNGPREQGRGRDAIESSQAARSRAARKRPADALSATTRVVVFLMVLGAICWTAIWCVLWTLSEYLEFTWWHAAVVIVAAGAICWRLW